MKIIIAPDSFKGSLTARDFCTIVGKVAVEIFPNAKVTNIPIADGGEGTVDALVWATGGQYQQITVTGPMGQLTQATYGILGDGETAVLEMAQASGLPLVLDREKDPLMASSYGTGEMLLQVLSRGYRKILLGIGGSATNDGGTGMLEALGVRFYDKSHSLLPGRGDSLAKIAHIDLTGLTPLAAQMELTVICDVTNPLLGPQGATTIYGPQKGVTDDLLSTLENGMANYAHHLEHSLSCLLSHVPGTGAAGGMGAAVYGVLGGALTPGVTAVLDAVGFDELMTDADLVITGEGRIDAQSIRYGKVPAGVAKRCGAKKIPLIAIVGAMAQGAEELYALTPSSIMTTVNAVMPLEQAIAQAPALLESAARRALHLVKIGQSLAGR